MPTVTLKKLTTTSFQGIDSSKPVIIDFSEYKNKNITLLHGDQGVGKTSTIHSLLYACGQSFDFKLDNLINNVDKTLSGQFEFEANGKQYKVTYTKTKFTLNRLFKDADEPESEGKWIPESDPKSLLKKLIGHVAISPMPLKEMKGEKQVQWLYDMLSVPQDVKDKEVTLKAELAEATKGYTNANSLYREISSALNQDEMYNNWQYTEEKYKEKKDIISVKKSFDEADRKRVQFSNAKSTLENLNNQLSDKKRTIYDLEVQLDLLKKEAGALNVRIAEGAKYISENEDTVQKEYDKAYNEMVEINEYNSKRTNWIEVVRKKKEMDEASDFMQEFEVRKKDKRVELKALVKKILPPIEGLEVETEEQIDGGRPVGIYLDGKTPAQLSESELFDFNFQVCISQGITMAFVENISSFGSATIDTLNRMADMGIRIFATLMDRRKKTLGIEIVDKIN